MAAFALSFYDLTRENIRHIYCDSKPHIHVTSPKPFSKCSQFLDVPLLRRFPPRFYDFYPAFNVGLPRAPAFNRMTLAEIREMVKRMGKPTACQLLWRDGSQEQGQGLGEQRSKRRKIVRFQSPVQESFETSSVKDGQDPKKDGRTDSTTKASSKSAQDTPTDGTKRDQIEEDQSKVKESPGTKVKTHASRKLTPEVKSSENSSVRETKTHHKVAESVYDDAKVKDRAGVRKGENWAEEAGGGGGTAAEPGGKKKKRKSTISKRAKVKESFSKLSLLPPINKGRQKQHPEPILEASQ